MRAASIYWHYANQAKPGAKLPGRGVTFCGWTQIAEHPTELLRVQDETGFRSYFSGVQTCGLRWVCPCCTASAAQTDRQRVNDGLAAGRQRGLWPVMITLTTRHHRKERAEDVVAGVQRAEQRLKTVKAWRRFADRIAGYARAFEWTHGKNGHHPHFHTIALVEADSEEEAIEAAKELQAAYMRQLESAGRDG
ncbi:protein rep, partial [Ralstonia pseudosolanacearum]|uniref:protein rep n=1 Tax=Ralstonia pseudosolanacearum TaxID=1310165 RepID=UPI003CE735A3